MSEVIIVHFYPDVLHYIYDNQIPDVFSPQKRTDPLPVEKIDGNAMIGNFVEGLRFYFDHPDIAEHVNSGWYFGKQPPKEARAD